jgi:hypothetical protein
MDKKIDDGKAEVVTALQRLAGVTEVKRRVDEGEGLVPGKRGKRGRRVAAWVLGIIFLLKVDNILWGYVGLPTLNIGNLCLLAPASLFLLVALAIRIFGKKWVRGTVVALLVFLAFEPWLVSPGAMHLLGYSMRVKEELDVPGVREFARTYRSPGETSSSASQPADVTVLFPAPSAFPPGCRRLGPIFLIHRSDRTITITNGSHFSDEYGVMIGQAARRKEAHWSIFSTDVGIKLDDDVYVWSAPGD